MEQGVEHRAKHVLTRLSGLDIPSISTLVRAWLDTGANLALAEPFVPGCVKAVSTCSWIQQAASWTPASDEMIRAVAQRAKELTKNTCRRIALTADLTNDEYLAQITGPNMRWEVLGIFCAAAARAALDTPVYSQLYNSENNQRTFIRSLAYLGDCCLEISLATDCLNDLQIILQYEHFHIHCRVHGDQSK